VRAQQSSKYLGAVQRMVRPTKLRGCFDSSSSFVRRGFVIGGGTCSVLGNDPGAEDVSTWKIG
jgi:hypothetical protein